MPLLRVEKGSITLITNTWPRRVIVTLIIIALAWFPIYRGYCIFRADRIIRSEQTVESYTRAIGFDPGNATLWWHRGRLRHYSVGTVDIPQAIADYQKALSMNPRISQAWVDLADCYERTGRYAQAEQALEQAIAVHTYSPITWWQAGNLFLRRGNLPRMYECFKMAGQYDLEKLGIAIDIAWKVDPERAGILEKLVPDVLAANLRYVDFLVSRDQVDLARAPWERALKNEVPPETEFKPASSFAYIDHLLAKSRVQDAVRVWDEALQKSGRGPRDRRLSKEEPNLVWNGSFESRILNGGFDWRYLDRKDAHFEADLSTRLDGLKALKVTFGGTNIQFSHLWQIVPVPEPGGYVLELYIRTEGLTTDQTPYFAIEGYPNASGAALRTDRFPESTPWKKLSYQFEVKNKCRAVLLILRRDLSSKFANLLKGTLWLDNVSIRQPAVGSRQ